MSRHGFATHDRKNISHFSCEGSRRNVARHHHALAKMTTMEHLIADFKSGMTEDDLTHLPEILALHDFGRAPYAGDIESFKLRGMRNAENRCLHHHVFDVPLAIKLVEFIGFTVQTVEELAPHHILVLAQKSKELW